MFASALRKSRIATLKAPEICLLLAIHILVLQGAAQQPNPAAAPQPEPRPIQFQNPMPSDQLTFLGGYAGQQARNLEKDKRFRSLMKAMTPRTEYHYGRDMPLSDAADDVLGGSRIPVEVREGRYVTSRPSRPVSSRTRISVV